MLREFELKMIVVIDDDGVPSLRRVITHIDELIDLDSWPEIDEIYCVELTEI